MSGLNRTSYRALMGVGEGQEALFECGGIWKRKREATWKSMSNHTNSTWIEFMDDLGKLRSLMMFIKYRNKPRELIFIIL